MGNDRSSRGKRARGGEEATPDGAGKHNDFEVELEELEYPATGAEIVARVGDYTIGLVGGEYTIGELVPETERETFDSPVAVRAQVREPAVAAAMKRVVEASEARQGAEFGWSQRKAYELTFQALESIDDDDDDEGVDVVCDWIMDQIDEKGALPSSRAVRRQAAKYCRAEGYEVSVDDWLGI